MGKPLAPPVNTEGKTVLVFPSGIPFQERYRSKQAEPAFAIFIYYKKKRAVDFLVGFR